jgi:hypothetical protein
MALLFQNFLSGALDANLLIAGTSMSSPGLADMDAISSDTMTVVLDPLGVNGDPEVVTVTAHTASATTATITRAQETTTARQHDSGTNWVASPVTAGLLDAFPAANLTGTASVNTTGSAATWTTGRNITFTGDVTGTVTGLDGSGNETAALTIGADTIETSMISYNFATDYVWTSETTQVTQNGSAINTDGAFRYMELGVLGIVTGRVSFNAAGSAGAIRVDVPGTGATTSAVYMNGSFRYAVGGNSHCGQVSGSVVNDYFSFTEHDTAGSGLTLPAATASAILDFWAIWNVG